MSHPHIFQITEQDLECHESLELSDLGKWCYLANGCYQGFYDTKEELEDRLKQIF